MKLEIFTKTGLTLIEMIKYNEIYQSYIFEKNTDCIIIDNHFKKDLDHVFDYKLYCEKQNYYMNKYSRLFRFNCIDEHECLNKVLSTINTDVCECSIDENTKQINHVHPDNTVAEKNFEDCFVDIFGNEALSFLHKEVPLNFNDKFYYIDYVVETKNHNIAFEANGVNYHHPCLVEEDYYSHLLEKQNIMVLFGYKTFRFSTNNLVFKNQMEDDLKLIIKDKDELIPKSIVKSSRGLKLYDHQTSILQELDIDRLNGKVTSLIVIPTGTGKSEIVISDLEKEYIKKQCKNILIMVPSLKIQEDWLERISVLSDYNIKIETYNKTFIEKNSLDKNYYDYIVFDEAHHAQATNCKKTLQYFIPKYLIGLTATDERLDEKKLEEIFGEYEVSLSIEEAVKKNIITNIRAFRLKSNISLDKVRFNGKDYAYADLEKTLVVNSRNELIAECLKNYFAPRDNFYKQGLIFCVNKEHCKRLSDEINKLGLTCAYVYGGNKNNDQIFDDYMNKKVQFICTCQLISEGWDSPQTEIVVMARPTLSKVLYLQQIGRGVRKYPNKECLYLIDVVDEMSSILKPYNFNSLFRIPTYSPFMGLINNNRDYLSIFGLNEYEQKMEQVDFLSFEEKYKDYFSTDQAARELYIDTTTLISWNKKYQYASVKLPLGNKFIYYYSKEDIERIRKERNCVIHTDEMMLDDFIKFVKDNNVTFSFKLVFMLSCLKLVDEFGEINISTLVETYKSFYLDRLNRNLLVDKSNCVYDYDYLNNEQLIKKNMLQNPFEKFERKRFLYLSKDLNVISFNRVLWDKLTSEIKEDIKEVLRKNLYKYYQKYGGLDYEYNL